MRNPSVVGGWRRGVLGAACYLLPLAAAAGGVRVIGTGYLTAGDGATGTACSVTNLGAKAVSLGTARLFLAPPAAPATGAPDGCSDATLAPRESVLGDSRGLRGECTLVDGSGTVLFAIEVR